MVFPGEKNGGRSGVPAGAKYCAQIKPVEAVPVHQKETLFPFEKRSGVLESPARPEQGLFMRELHRGQSLPAQKSAALDHSLADAYLNLGELYRSRGRFARALGIYREGLQREPHNARLHFALAESLLSDKRLEEAVREFKRAGELDDEMHEVDYKIGLCYFYLGRGEEAALALRRYLRREPKDREARSLLDRCDY